MVAGGTATHGNGTAVACLAVFSAMCSARCSARCYESTAPVQSPHVVAAEERWGVAAVSVEDWQRRFHEAAS